MDGAVDRDDACELCQASRLTPWFHEDEECWIAECEACAVPMVVWRPHRTDPPAEVEARLLDRLHAVADEVLGEHWLDPDRRSIPDHWHVHARPRGGFGGWR